MGAERAGAFGEIGEQGETHSDAQQREGAEVERETPRERACAQKPAT
jgi:hypothetical protein